MRAHSRNRLDSRGSDLVSKITERFLTIRSAKGFWCAIRFYTMMRTTRVVIGRCSWSITVHYTWMASQKFCLTWRTVLKMFVRLFRIEQVKASLKFSRSYFQRRKMKEWRQKELLTTGGCLNYKKSSQQLPSCVVAKRDQIHSFAKCFRDHSTLSKWRRWKAFHRNCIQVR